MGLKDGRHHHDHAKCLERFGDDGIFTTTHDKLIMISLHFPSNSFILITFFSLDIIDHVVISPCLPYRVRVFFLYDLVCHVVCGNGSTHRDPCILHAD